MTSQTVVTARDVRASIEALERKLDEAGRYTYSYNGCPAYVYRKMQYFNLKIRDLQRQARVLRRRVPEKFVTEK